MTTDTTERQTLNAAYKIGLGLGRKFEHTDVQGSPVLMQAARIYASNYDGDFSYMVEMRNAALQTNSLTVGQSKGVLNCLMADAKKRMQQGNTTSTPIEPTVAADYGKISKGRFTVVFDAANPSDRITVEIAKWDGYTDRKTGVKRDDVRTLKYLMGPDSDYMFAAAFDGQRVLFSKGAPRALRALELLARADGADQAAMGAAYAFESSRCWRCGRELTVEDSVAGGIGPICAGKVEAEYGGAATEAGRAAMARLAQGGTKEGQETPSVVKVAPVAARKPAPIPSAKDFVDMSGVPMRPGGRTYEEVFGK